MKADPVSRVETCVVYTTDTTYLFPTLVSAMQARNYCSVDKADVIIFCLGLDDKVKDVFEPVCVEEGVKLIAITREMIEGQTAMLARLFLNRYVPAQYSQYLYLDGDVHILESIDPLLEIGLPPGHLLAANDPMTFLLADNSWQSRSLSRHLASVGLSREQALNYFNSGVLRISREGWETTGLDAWRYYQRNGGPSRFPDQDALNLAAVEKRLPMSLAWNFPIFMRNFRVELDIKPKITHFMSSPKPWHGSFPPWTSVSCLPYDRALTSYPSLVPYSMSMSLRERATYHLQQRFKKASEMVTWGMSARRGRILSYEASCAL
ncbi:MAG TPA: glycosyltransferase [Acidisarcina sp.]